MTAASEMRVDVDVYKGPLSKPMPMQWADLRGIVRESLNSFAAFDQQYRTSYLTDETWKESCAKSKDVKLLNNYGNPSRVPAAQPRTLTAEKNDQFPHDDNKSDFNSILLSMKKADTAGLGAVTPATCLVMDGLYIYSQTMVQALENLKLRLDAASEFDSKSKAKNLPHRLGDQAAVVGLTSRLRDGLRVKIKSLDKKLQECQKNPPNTQDTCSAKKDEIEADIKALSQALAQLGMIDNQRVAKDTVRNIKACANNLAGRRYGRLAYSLNQLALKLNYAAPEGSHTPEEILQDVEQVATQLRASATSLSGFLMSYVPNSQVVRTTFAALTNLASEYGNQLGSRANALALQHQGQRGGRLSTAILLQDANPTDFPNLHHWLDATMPGNGMVSYPPNSLLPQNDYYVDQVSRMPALDRIRIYERLMKDNFWSQVNTVYASGAGTVRMALIKDDIGNWNLKSFDADPTDLMDAYFKMGSGIARVAGDMVVNGGSGLLLDSLKIPTNTDQGIKIDILDKVHGKTIEDLVKLKEKYKKMEEDAKTANEKDKTKPEMLGFQDQTQAAHEVQNLLDRYQGLKTQIAPAY